MLNKAGHGFTFAMASPRSGIGYPSDTQASCGATVFAQSIASVSVTAMQPDAAGTTPEALVAGRTPACSLSRGSVHAASATNCEVTSHCPGNPSADG